MKRTVLFVMLTAVLLFGGVVSAQATENLKIEDWKGHSFTFMSLPDNKQAEGYGMFRIEDAVRGFDGDASLRIPYAGHVGKQVLVTEVVPFSAGYDLKEYMVYMTVKESGEKLVARSMRGQVNNLVRTSDLENARKQFLGKTVYSKLRELSGVPTPEMKNPPAVSVGIGFPVVVLDVYPGIQVQDPIWLIVSVSGKKAILPMNYSWTNMPLYSWTNRPAWEDDLFLDNPRVAFNWSTEMWRQIEAANVTVGMFKEQVRLSWGEATSKQENGFVWIYGSKKLKFNGEVLVSIEDVSESGI